MAIMDELAAVLENAYDPDEFLRWLQEQPWHGCRKRYTMRVWEEATGYRFSGMVFMVL